MENPIQKLTQSRYFTPAFNAAIYDGPLRIYFAQTHESEALKIYFHLQQKIMGDNPESCAQMRESGRNIFVMLYPSDEIFAMSFEGEIADAPTVVCEKMGADFVVGIRGPVEETDYSLIYERLLFAIRKYDSQLDFI